MTQERAEELSAARQQIETLREALTTLIVAANCTIGHWNEFGAEMDLANVMDILDRTVKKITASPPHETQG